MSSEDSRKRQHSQQEGVLDGDDGPQAKRRRHYGGKEQSSASQERVVQSELDRAAFLEEQKKRFLEV